MLSDFKKFVLRGNVVDLAVAVVVGVAFTATVTAFVADLITPLIAAIFGKPDFANLTFRLHHSTFRYGSFLNALLSFLIVATVVFFAVVVPLTSLMRRLNLLPTDEPKARDAGLPRMPERDPGCGAPLRVLHLGDGGGVAAPRPCPIHGGIQRVADDASQSGPGVGSSARAASTVTGERRRSAAAPPRRYFAESGSVVSPQRVAVEVDAEESGGIVRRRCPP